MGLKDIRAVLLDMDGTLVASDASVERAWTVWARHYDVDPELAVAGAHGSPADATVRRLRPDLDASGVVEAAAFQLALQYDDLADVTPAVGSRRLMDVLARHEFEWAVVTSADRRLARARLGAAGIIAPVLITVEDVTAGKPDPQGYLLASHRLGIPPARCLVVEDTEIGVEAGRSAGAMTAALKGLDADIRVGDLRELADLLDSAADGR